MLIFHIMNVPSQIILQALGTQSTAGLTRIAQSLTCIHELKEGTLFSGSLPMPFFFSQEKILLEEEQCENLVESVLFIYLCVIEPAGCLSKSLLKLILISLEPMIAKDCSLGFGLLLPKIKGGTPRKYMWNGQMCWSTACCLNTILNKQQ